MTPSGNITEMVIEYLRRKPGASNEEVAIWIRGHVPGANTTPQSVASIKSRAGLRKPRDLSEEALPWVGEVEDDGSETVEEAARRIAVRYGALERMTRRLVMQEMPSLIVSGPPGLGKSFTMRAAIDECAVEDSVVTWVGGAISAVGLYQALYECRDGGVLVLDDCDDVFRDEVSLNLLKVALDSSPTRMVSWRKEAGWLTRDDIPETFDFQGHVCFITNIDFEAAIETGRRDAEHFKALIDRSMYLCLTLRSRRDFMIRIREVADGDDGMLVRSFGLTPKQAAEAMAFIDEHKERFYNLSLRLAGQIALCMRADPEGWREDIEATKMRTL